MSIVTPAEERIAEMLEPPLENLRAVLHGVAALARACAEALEASRTGSAACDAQLILLPRVADTTLAISTLMSYGHELSAVALSAVAYELAHLAAFIGPDDDLARRWLEWTDPKRLPWKVDKLTNGALVRAGRGDKSTVDRQYIFYTLACVAKHGSPLSLKHRPAATSATQLVLNADPAFTPNWGNDAITATMITGSSALLSTDGFWLSFPEAVTLQLVLMRNDLAPRWNQFADWWANRPGRAAS